MNRPDPQSGAVPLPAPGKWPAADLARLLSAYARPGSPDVLLGPAVGEDAAVLRLGRERLVVATDPITLATDQAGWYAVVVNANDVAATGARPRFFLAVALLPVTARLEDADALFRGLADACHALGVALVGGHTERTAGLDRPIIVGTMIGDLEGREPVTSGGAHPGDAVILTKGAAIEATAVLARERADALAGRVPDDVLARARDYLADPGISVVEDARVACELGARAMHDVTEGGVLTGLWEMAQAADLGIHVHADAVPVRPETRALCDAADVDPLQAIGSGALLVAVPPGTDDALVAAYSQMDIHAAVVATFGRKGGPRTVSRAGRTEPLVPPAADAIARLSGA